MDNSQIKINQEKEKAEDEQTKYRPTIKQQNKLAEFMFLFETDKQARDNDVKRFFNERTLEVYLDDCQKRINGYVEPRKNAEDWQVRYRNLLTRNKMMAVLSKIATVRMKMKFKSADGNRDTKKLRIFNALYNHYLDLDNADMKQFMEMWDAWQNGTIISWVLPEKTTRKIKKITDYDSETGEYEVVESILHNWKITSRILPLQDVWFGNLRETEEQKQPHVWLRFLPSFQEFKADWVKMPNAKYVVPTTGNQDADVFYRSANLADNKVEILWYLNVWEDRMVIWANKVELYDGPIPYMANFGKFYPLAVGWNEPIASDFIYGKSGADKLKGDQDLIDLFFRKLADRVILTSNPPIFVEGNPDLPETMKLKPGVPIGVDSIAGIREFAFQQNASDILGALKVFQESANLTSVSDASQGVSQANRTATADNIAEQAIRNLVGLFQFFVENFMAKKAMLYAYHILQGLNTPEKMIVSIEDGKETIDEDYGIFSEHNVMLEDGTKGDIIYKIVGTPEELHTTEELDMKEALAQSQGRSVRYVEITPDYFKDFLANVEPAAGSSLEQSSSLKKQIEKEFQVGFMNFFPELFMQNQLEFAKDYVEVYEKEADRLLGNKQMAQPDVMAQMQAAGGQGPTAPRPNVNQGVAPELKRMMNV